MDKLIAALKDFVRPDVIWALVAIGLLLLELMLPGLVIFFFAVGAFVVAIVCLFTDIALSTQLLIFIGASIVSLVALRRWLKTIFMGHVASKQNARENFDEFVGEKGVATSVITPKAGGRIELHGTSWQAEADEEIAEGTVVEIIGKDNITFKVKPL